MLRRLTVGCAFLTACSVPDRNGDHDHRVDDAGVTELDGSVAPGDADADAPAMPDAPVADTTPPHLMMVTPGPDTATWLGAPVRFVFDEMLDPLSVAGLTASAEVAGQAVTSTVAFEAPSTVLVSIDPTARGLGSLAVHLAGSVKDPAGNAASVTQDLSLQLPPWSTVPVDRGTAASSPTLAVGRAGSIYAAWTVGSAGSRKLVISVLEGTTWRALGSTLGASDVTSSALTLDEDGTPIVAWVEVGAIRIARYTPGTGNWALLPSPSNGTYVALATPAGGTPTLAIWGSSAAVYSLENGAWQPLGTEVAIPAPLASEPVLATSAPNQAAIGWIDEGGALRVFRLDGSTWTSISPLAVGTGGHLSLAARGSSLAIAWEQLAGSYGVLAAQATNNATAWTRLGRALDVDIEGDAVTPAIALDSTNNAVVAWTELVEDKQRGVVARWTGSSWSIVGGVTWLQSATAVPQRSQLVLAAGDTPVVATAAGGSAVLARFNGPRTPALGLANRPSISGCGFSVASPPNLLSQTGCFTLATANRPVPHQGLVPYDIVAPLWSDGALKRRWIGLPDGGSMTLGSNGAWVAPVGTVMVKQFDIEMTPGDPATRRPIETRFFINDASLGWKGFSYRWNTAGTDATLQPADTAETYTWTLTDGTQHPHQYPSRQHCNSCHYYAMGPLLGLRPEQLQRWYDYDGVIAQQLPTLAALGIGPSSSAQPLVSQFEPSETWEHRMRGYMAGNCQHCHNPNYISIKDLRYTTPLAQTRLCEVITPGDPANSVVYQKVSNRPGMPALGSVVVDPLAVQMLGNWITGMTSCP